MEESTPREPRPWSKKAPEGKEWDVIVIGSGIGGMTTAALLSKMGKKVLVLEQHYVPGGFTHTFRRKGFVWDVGVHISGEVTEKALPGRILKYAAPDLKWEKIPGIYDEFTFPEGFKIGFASDPKEFAATLKAAFPHEAEGVDLYMAEIRNTVRAMRNFYLGQILPGRLGRFAGRLISREAAQLFATPASQVVDRIFKDPKIKAVVLAQWGYHGAVPSEASWAMQALTVRHFMHGAYYPVGGAGSIAKSLLKTVAEAGGWTRICADVDHILIENGRASGVRMVDGETIRARRVVSAAGAWTTATRLLPPEFRDEAWAQKMGKHRAGPAHLSLYLGFEGDIASAGATKNCQWFYNTWDYERPNWEVAPGKKVGRPDILFTSYPSLKDPEHSPGPKQKHTGEIITFVPWESFQKWQGTEWRKRGEDYEAFKEEMSQAMLAVVFEAHPGLKPMLVHYELSTPLSTDKFARPYHGSIYGLLPTPERYSDKWLRPQTPIPGLYQSGSDVATCGVIGAMMGGTLAAVAMEPIKGARFMNQVIRGR